MQGELRDLVDLHPHTQIELVYSPEPWNPVASVLLRSVTLPPNILPVTADIRVPIPDLYGFAQSASVILLKDVLHCVRDDTTTVVPGLQKAEERHVASHKQYYADLRSNHHPLLHWYFLYLTPRWSATGFRHVPLIEVLGRFVEYLHNPYCFLGEQIDYCQRCWSTTHNPWWLLRVAELYLEAGEMVAARQALSQGQQLFPTRPDFSIMLAALRS